MLFARRYKKTSRTKRAHVFVYGDVVGVGFRAWAVGNAVKLGLTGRVRNASFEAVEAVFEGEERKIKEMVEICRKGPETAWVEKVEIKWEKPEGEFAGFGIGN